MTVGEPFDPRPKVCGFHPTDAVDRDRTLGDGAKRLYDRLYRLALKTGKCYASTTWLAEALGKPARTIEWDLAQLEARHLIRRHRHGCQPRSLDFLFHEMHNSQPIAGCEAPSNPQPIADQERPPIRKTAPSNPQDSTFNPQPIADKPEKLIIGEPEKPDSPPAAVDSLAGEGKRPKGTKVAVDDEKDQTLEDPDAELLRRLTMRHGNNGTDALKIKALIREKLDPWEPLGATLIGFLAVDQKQTTGRVRNPAAYYTALVDGYIATTRGRMFNNPERLQRAIDEEARRLGWT